MKINLAKTAGFCFGVRRALEIALSAVRSGKEIYMLGDIVHNEDVVRQMRNAGIKKINTLSMRPAKTLLIRAHGTGVSVIKQAKKFGYKIIDATCPMVKEIHNIAKGMEKQGYRIIVIGDKNHDEVRGIIGQLKTKAIIIDTAKPVPLKQIRDIPKAAVVVQSTQNEEKVLRTVGVLKNRIKKLRFFNTICQPTRMKQKEIQALALENEVMIIIGSKTSANTKRLFEISRSLNKRSYWISAKKQLRPAWFKNAKTTGITAGASTPDSTTQEIIRQIKNYKYYCR